MTPGRRHIRFSPWPILFTLAAIAMAVGVFAVTQRVQHRESHVEAMNRQLLAEQQAVRVLGAEWAYLTRPQRLETLIAMKENHDVMPPVPAPIVTVEEETAKTETVAAIEPVAAAAEPAAVVETAPTPVKEKAAVKKEEPKKPSVKKVSAQAKPKMPTKTGAMKAASVKAGAPAPDVWRITPKKAYVPQRPQQVIAYKPRAGVARPIVE